MTIQDLMTADLTPLFHLGKAVLVGWVIGQAIVVVLGLAFVIYTARKINRSFK